MCAAARVSTVILAIEDVEWGIHSLGRHTPSVFARPQNGLLVSVIGPLWCHGALAGVGGHPDPLCC